MPAIDEKIDLIIVSLKRAAIKQRYISWREIFAICDDAKKNINANGGDYAGDVFRTLEAAGRDLCA